MNSIVVKIGGAAGVDTAPLIQEIARLSHSGAPIVLVHGTSAAADALAERVGVPVRRLVSPTGHVSRYTDPQTLEIYVAAAAGQVNKQLVSDLQHLGCNALGLSGMDGRLLMARRKAAVRSVENGRQRIVRDDYTGQIEGANGELLGMLLTHGYTPVVAPLALGAEGEALNVDGDRAAAMLAGALGASALIILSNVPGLLAHFPDERSLVRHVPTSKLDWADSLAEGRMKRKVLAAREALGAGVQRVILADSRRSDPLSSALAGEGTVFGEPVEAAIAMPLPVTAPVAAVGAPV